MLVAVNILMKTAWSVLSASNLTPITTHTKARPRIRHTSPVNRVGSLMFASAHFPDGMEHLE